MTDPHPGERVRKVGGDYTFEGEVVCVFEKLSAAVRVVVENNDGVLHIFSPGQLERVPPKAKSAPRLRPAGGKKS